MPILEKNKIKEALYRYYVETYSEQNTDIWYEQPAINVWVFGRTGKIISLQCHILTGEVTAYEESSKDSTEI